MYRSVFCPPVIAEITAPTLWIKQLVYKENKQNSSTSRKQGETKKLILSTEGTYYSPICIINEHL